MKTRIIRTQYKLKYKSETESNIQAACHYINKDIEGWPIHYACSIAEYDGEDIIFIESEVEASTFKDCESLLRLFKDSVRKNFNKQVVEILKAKLERI